MTITVTLDTTCLDDRSRARLEQCVAGIDVQIENATVSNRETEGTSVRPFPDALPEVWVLGEGRLGKIVPASAEINALLEQLLTIIGSGAFPPVGRRRELTVAQRHQFRDANILATHVRERRDIFVTADLTAFGDRSPSAKTHRRVRRQQLEAVCGTQIMTLDEFCAFCDAVAGRTTDALPPAPFDGGAESLTSGGIVGAPTALPSAPPPTPT